MSEGRRARNVRRRCERPPAHQATRRYLRRHGGPLELHASVIGKEEMCAVEIILSSP